MYREDNYKLFQSKSEEYNKKSADLRGMGGKISALRAVTFIAGFCFVAVGIADDMTWAWLVGIAVLICFIMLIRYHNILDKQLKAVLTKAEVVNRFCDIFNDKWNQYSDTGEEFIEKGDFFVTDLDILGPNSLYQKISMCSTFFGRKRLASVLGLKGLVDDRTVRAEAISELGKDIDFAVDFAGTAKRIANGKLNNSRIEEFIAYCNNDKSGKLPSWTRIIRILLPAAELILILAWIFNLVNYGYPLAGLLVLISFSLITKKVTDDVIGPLYIMGVMLEPYTEILELVNDKEFFNEKLNSIKNRLCGKDGMLVAFNQLKTVSQAYNISYNPVVHQMLCGTILWDYQLAAAMERWKKNYGANISDCFMLIGELEELLSLAALGMVHSHCQAEINEGTEPICFNARRMYHPLIVQKNVVPNDAELKNGITIITGSNMSGKTTFLRTMAINLALSYMGAPVCAESLSSSYMKIFTSMRVTDDVANGISTFYAEILRIKTMAEYKKEGKPMLCLIDEIFKGTNSADRIVGAKEVITQLTGANNMVIVSTHDFELCSLKDEEGNPVINYHFEEYYDNDELKFDYTIKDGRCTTTNARAILKMAGFKV